MITHRARTNLIVSACAAVAAVCALSPAGPANADCIYVASGVAGVSTYYNIETFASPGAGSVFATVSGDTMPAGLALDGVGNLYVGSFSPSEVLRITPGGTQSVFTTYGMQGAYPDGLACDGAGNLYASAGNNAIFKFTPAGSPSVFAFGPSDGLSGPAGLALDSAGNLYAANNWDGKVIKFAPSNYPLNVGTVFADTGAPGLTGLAFDHAGDLFVSNTQAGTIQEITPGGAVSVFATGLGGPAGLAFDSVGDLYVVDQGYSPEYGAYAIVEFTPAGVGSVFASGLYGAEFIAIQPTPEPAAFSLLVLGGLGLLRRRAGRASPPLRGEPPKGGG